MKKQKPIVLETFRPIGPAEVYQMQQDHPSCFNNMVRVRKYRVTIEEIDEPDDVIHARVRELWATATNHHNKSALREFARKRGITL